LQAHYGTLRPRRPWQPFRQFGALFAGAPFESHSVTNDLQRHGKTKKPGHSMSPLGYTCV
jgi:hypothetical protein